MQAENSQYYVYGHVVSHSETRMEPELLRPYTYWHVHVAEQLYGDSVGSEILVRQPGGEVGETGYRVAGTAEFAAGEEVFIALRDTNEGPGTKEVVGLASGKFRVDSGTDGKKIVVSGLGLPVTGGNGETFSPENFKELLRRVARKETTEADRNVFVTRNPTHEASHEPKSENRTEQRRPAPSAIPAETVRATASTAPIDDNSVQKRAPSSEEPGTGSSAFLWIVAAVLSLALLGVLALVLKR